MRVLSYCSAARGGKFGLRVSVGVPSKETKAVDWIVSFCLVPLLLKPINARVLLSSKTWLVLLLRTSGD